MLNRVASRTPEAASTPSFPRSTQDDLRIRYGMASAAGPIRTSSREVVPVVCAVRRRVKATRDRLNETLASIKSTSSSSGFEGVPRMSSNVRPGPARLATSLIAHTGHSEEEPEKLHLPTAANEAGSF